MKQENQTKPNASYVSNATTLALRTLNNMALLGFETVWPDRCLVCGRPTPGKRDAALSVDPPMQVVVCGKCRRLLVMPPSAFCKQCARMIPPGKSGSLCGRCSDHEWFFSQVLPLHSYYGLSRAVVLRLKHSKNRLFADTIARLYYESRKTQLVEFAPDCVVATPMNWRRKYFIRGGVNAPDALARRLAKELCVPCMSRRLRRIRATPAQTTVEWEERAANVRGAFKIKNRFGVPEFLGKRVLLVDDAFTTGATANEISRVLMDAGAADVCVATLTRAGLGRGSTSRS